MCIQTYSVYSDMMDIFITTISVSIFQADIGYAYPHLKGKYKIKCRADTVIHMYMYVHVYARACVLVSICFLHSNCFNHG